MLGTWDDDRELFGKWTEISVIQNKKKKSNFMEEIAILFPNILVHHRRQGGENFSGNSLAAVRHDSFRISKCHELVKYAYQSKRRKRRGYVCKRIAVNWCNIKFSKKFQRWTFVRNVKRSKRAFFLSTAIRFFRGLEFSECPNWNSRDTKNSIATRRKTWIKRKGDISTVLKKNGV